MALMLVASISMGLVYASGYALPRDPLYPVKTLLEEIQHTFTTDEANHAQLHLKFAATRLGEVASLLAAERYDDISIAMSSFEAEMREAMWVLAGLAGDEQPHVWALESLLVENFENHTDALNELVHRAPNDAQPAIDYAVNVLVEETEALRALIHEMTPDSPPSSVVDGVTVDEPAASAGGSSDEESVNEAGGSEGPTEPEPTAVPVAVSTPTMYAQGSIGALMATRRAREMQISIPTMLSTFWVTPTQVSPPHGNASETPTRTPPPFPHP
jgi:hypothetical protein